MSSADEILVVEDLKKHFPVTRGIIFQKEVATVKAVDGISFTLREGETLGIVGESGCGKSTLVRCLLKLLEPTGGRIVYEGRDITKLSRREMRPLRRNMMMVFQDPYASLNARKRVGFIIGEALELHGIGTPAERKRRVQELLEVVGLNPEHFNRFPHEFSGGQRQRIGVARALAVNPKLIFCDEPVSALDVSVQAQILNLLKDLQREFGLTYVFIAHDLNVVRHISDRVMVMYLGKAAELAARDELYANPKHPYTGALLSALADQQRARLAPRIRIADLIAILAGHDARLDRHQRAVGGQVTLTHHRRNGDDGLADDRGDRFSRRIGAVLDVKERARGDVDDAVLQAFEIGVR
jgi:ABC-type oligopeptide transport system ATPase subunit